MASTIKGITVALGGDTTGLVKSIDSLDKKSRNLQSELSQINRLLKFNPDNAALLAQKQAVLAEKVQAARDKLKLLKDMQAEVEREAKSGTLGAEQYRAYQREVEHTQGVLQNLERQIEETDSQFAHATQGINGINLGEAERKVAGFGDSVKDMADTSMTKLDNLSDKFNNVGNKLESAGIAINTAVSSKVAQKLSEGVTDAMDFEDAIAKVSTIADETEVPMDKMREQILALSNETGIAATDIAENVYNAISAGQKTGDAVNFVAKSLSLSKAGFADTGAALDVLTTIMNAYGMSAEEVGNISDMLIQTQNLGKVTVGELASSMGKVIPTANQYGVSLDQLAAAYSITTAKGIAAAESTTYINSMLNELGKSGTKTSDLLKEKTGKTFTELMKEGCSLSDVLQIVAGSAAEGVNYFNKIDTTIQNATGKSFKELQDEGYSLSQIMELINQRNGDNKRSFNELNQALKDGTGKSFKQLSEEGYDLSEILTLVDEKTGESVKGFSDMWSSAEAAKAASTLLGDSASVFNDRLKEMNSSTGATDKALGKLKTTSTETKKIVNELKNAGIDLGDEVLKQAAPLLKDVMGGVKNLTSWLKKLKPEQKEQLTKALEIIAVAGPAVTLIGKGYKGIGNLIGIIPKMTAAQKGLNAALSANPVGAVTLAITAFVAVLGGAITAINAFHDAQLENAGFKQQLDDMQETVDKISEIRDSISNTVADIKNASLAAGSEIGVMDDYRKRLGELLEKSNLTPAEQAELTTIGDYFAQKYPEFEKTWNEYISVDDNGRVKISGNVEELKGKLDSLISKYKQVAAQAALSNLAQQNAEAVVNSRQQVRDAAAEMLKASEELEKFQKEWDLTDENLTALASAQPWFEWENADKSVKLFASDVLAQYNSLVEKGAETTRSYEAVVEKAAQLKQSGDDLARMQAVVNGNYDDASAVLMTYNEGLIKSIDVEQSKWKSLDNLKTKAEETAAETGSNLVYGLKNGIEKYKTEIFDSGIEQARLYLDSFDATMGIESPSKEMYKRGQQTVQGFINGLKDGTGLSNIWNTAKNVASTALNAVKNFLGINSPSKEAEKLGSFFGEGFSNGIDKQTRNAALSAAEMAQAARNGLTGEIIGNSVSRLSGLKYGEISGTPTVTNTSTTTNNSPIQISVQATINNDADIDRLAQQLGQKIAQQGVRWG